MICLPFFPGLYFPGADVTPTPMFIENLCFLRSRKISALRYLDEVIQAARPSRISSTWASRSASSTPGNIRSRMKVTALS